MRRNRIRGVILAGALAGAALAQFQITSKPVDLPNGPAAPGFDIKRFSNAGNGAYETFYVQKPNNSRDRLGVFRLVCGMACIGKR